MRERQNVKARPEGRLSTQLSAYFKSYVKTGNLEDTHVPVFRALQTKLNANTVLYPGCHRHITPSLFFPSVHYVDFDAKVSSLYSDTKALDFINSQKEYSEPSQITFSCQDYTATEILLESQADLLISLSAGIVSSCCQHYLKPNGHFLVNDSHSDATVTYLNSYFKLVAVYNESTRVFDETPSIITQCFYTEKGEKITQDMANESIHTPKSKRSFRLKFESRFYLFQKKHNDSEPIDDDKPQLGTGVP